MVATRFHNVLMSLLLDKPVIAISFHHKCSSLMHEMGLSEYCHDINRINADALIEQFQALVRNADDVKQVILQRVEKCKQALDEQYELLFDDFIDQLRAPRGSRGCDEMRIVSQPRGGAVGERRHRGVIRQGVEKALLKVNRRIWRRLPPRVHDLRAAQAYGRWLHALTSRNADREMYVGTLFLRNRPALELMRRLAGEMQKGSTMRVAVLGCSVGVEVYSILWALRRARPDLTILVDALDISPAVLAIAEDGIYGPQTSEAVHESIFVRLSEAELCDMFDWDGDQARVKPLLREGVTWRLGDAADPTLIEELGPKDLVVANNFLCHVDAPSAERCLRNLVRLVGTDGYLFVSGVDLNVRTNVAFDLGWEPVPELLAEIHEGDPLVRADWPLHWWGLEPVDRRRHDWQTRYASVFRAGRHA